MTYISCTALRMLIFRVGRCPGRASGVDARKRVVATRRILGAQPSAQPEETAGRVVGPPCLVKIHSDPRTEEIVVVDLRGEIDYGCEEMLLRCLTSALNSSARGIAIDFSKVSFWACSSVKVLLATRRLAQRDGKTMSLRALSPMVRRVLELSESLHLFTTEAAPGTPHPDRRPATVAPSQTPAPAAPPSPSPPAPAPDAEASAYSSAGSAGMSSPSDSTGVPAGPA
ncbi:STAS domain-containing protein [Streptomyces lydicus]|uniref:STAS domain-containing protein n=1 Tax=Streptomyces lydicus TaxID=47763 RepID=UPI0035BE184F